MAEKVLHKNPRSQVRVCRPVPLRTPDHEQLSVQCLLRPIWGWGGNMAVAHLWTATHSWMVEVKPVSALL